MIYQFLSTAFCVIVIISNIISAKMVALPVFESFLIPAGLITYPLTFVLSDLVTEFFGANKAKRMVYTTLAMNVLTFGILKLALWLPGQTPEEDLAFHNILGLSGLRIFSSLAAYSVAQLIDIQAYSMIKKWTGLRFLWVRANGSTWISQLVDTLLIDLIFLYWGLGMTFVAVLPIMLFSALYKIFFSLLMTPIFYLLVALIRSRISLYSDPGKKEGAALTAAPRYN